MEYFITVCESVRKIVRVEADDEQSAYAKVEAMYDNGMIDMEKDVDTETGFYRVKR